MLHVDILCNYNKFTSIILSRHESSDHIEASPVMNSLIRNNVLDKV